MTGIGGQGAVRLTISPSYGGYLGWCSLNMVVKPILRWAGSKRKLLPQLLKCVPDFDRYVEPFAGSACLFFALTPSRAVLGDFNGDLINAYRILKRDPINVARAVRAMPKSEAYYYQLRETTFDDKFHRATQFFYLNHFSFNGVYRTNRRGQYNVPRGSKVGSMPTMQTFELCAHALRSARLRTADFQRCLSDIRPSDFFYLDPPYATQDKRNRGEYGCGAFDSLDVPRLLSTLRLIDLKGAKFLLSYVENEELRVALEKHWTRKVILVRRHVAGFQQHRRRVKEVLLANYKIPCKARLDEIAIDCHK